MLFGEVTKSIVKIFKLLNKQKYSRDVPNNQYFPMAYHIIDEIFLPLHGKFTNIEFDLHRLLFAIATILRPIYCINTIANIIVIMKQIMTGKQEDVINLFSQSPKRTTENLSCNNTFYPPHRYGFDFKNQTLRVTVGIEPLTFFINVNATLFNNKVYEQLYNKVISLLTETIDTPLNLFTATEYKRFKLDATPKYEIDC
jgi:hypothetical protein